MVTVQQLIDALQAVEDKSGYVEVAIEFKDRINPIYGNVIPNEWGNIFVNNPWGGIRLNTQVKPASFLSYYSVREIQNKGE